jgi:hypothetical protein
VQVKFNILFDILTDFNLRCDWGHYDGCTNLDECTTVPRDYFLWANINLEPRRLVTTFLIISLSPSLMGMGSL